MDKSPKEEADRLYEKFGKLAIHVVYELIDASYQGYDYDREWEVPFYNDVKQNLIETKRI